MNSCAWCSLSPEERRWLLWDSGCWSVYLADEQDYVGRCVLVSTRHCESLSALNDNEWAELKMLVDRLERCCLEVLGAAMCNWSCLMNSFYKAAEPNPHLHIHLRPRYAEPLVLNGHIYSDAEFGHHYSSKKLSQLAEEDRPLLFSIMKSALNDEEP